MKQIISLFILVGCLVPAGTAFGITTLDLECTETGRGYLPFNKVTGQFIGSGYLFNKSSCQKALSTLREDLGQGVLCSWNETGWVPFHAVTGKPITEDTIWFELKTCELALASAKNNIVCAPRSTGSGVFDVKYNQFVGAGFYFDIGICMDASSSSTNDDVCAPERDYTAIFSRWTNIVWDNELWMTAKQCGRHLSLLRLDRSLIE